MYEATIKSTNKTMIIIWPASPPLEISSIIESVFFTDSPSVISSEPSCTVLSIAEYSI